MLDDLFSYFWALWGYARWLLAGGPFFVDAILKRAFPSASAWLDKRLRPTTRVRIEVSLLFLAVFAAGFFSWRDEHQLRLSAEGHPIAGRRLTEAEKDALRKAFDGKNNNIPVIIVSAVSSPEAERYAYDFTSLFTSMKFTSPLKQNAIALEDSDTGLMVGIADPDKPSDAAKLFIKLLLDAGFRIKQVAYDVPKQTTPDFDLFVGERGYPR
jgi:hypothetical protein